ncbi:cation:proton antiporter [Altererythrobacter arenosus]|uniref:Cation:proton antiporter n=1 Tax=Altererythrobacter arenosus TaxID=3032592 RepID=A0ABY8FQZ6_9SPHN|nr:cation:proton antiporter [Altererythrobacter sp. CAU 1644]WFL77441.1 cation:proton antiporter [Altererythrobacter sp. CAU 1644]
MEGIGLLVVLAAIFTFAMFGRRLERTIITAPMVFLAVGYALSSTDWLPEDAARESLEILAEVTLVILLFLDASQIDLGHLKKQHVWPQRMLIRGMPLAIVFGTLAAWLFFPSWPLVALALVAALLTPTDAALGQSILMNKQIPVRVRRSLTVESGLNDGLALPAVLLFASLTAQAMDLGTRDWLLFAILQLTLGPLVGVVIGYAAGKAHLAADERMLSSRTLEGIAALTLAMATYLIADLVGGNGFMAAFVGGLCFGNIVKGKCDFVFEFSEGEGQLLMWGTFLLVGLTLLPDALAMLDWRVAGLILVSLFIVRPLAIWLSLAGSDASPTTRLFFGWFGPRGLATAIFALLIIEKLDGWLAAPIMAVAINAVWISALLHGVTAAPLGNAYARKAEATDECPEKMAIIEPFGRV